MRLRARLSAALVAPACAVALAACGGGSDDERPLADPAPSPSATSAAPALSPSPEPSAPVAGTEAPGAAPSAAATPTSASTPRSTPTYATPSAPVTVSPSPSDAAAADDVVREVKVTIAGGKVTPPPSHVDVKKGTVVRIIVTSDVDDELHVHGYDVEGELPAGSPGSIEFTADETGSFEVETHESGLLLFQLLVK
ncbi:cupredoxin domain-containing protein [Motilibacter aurantiacus]|uniref:hypothetical protein n=1 Tax=Motilibacter aurantiacus TaxID=2714955 RepID=UPI00140BE9BC|nr:hypothetical protein [Motilibacter aurantiacus]NHC43716.1 hypothetical protein [Motilibacter aurantiacus]